MASWCSTSRGSWPAPSRPCCWRSWAPASSRSSLPGGDEARGFGPFAGEHSLYFIGVNQGKAGLSLDLKQPQGLDLARRLTDRADVLLENFRPGTLERLGLGYATISDRNPRLVYCSLSGFGQFGPRSSHGAYDVIIQAASGLMGLTGPEGGPPVRVTARRSAI